MLTDAELAWMRDTSSSALPDEITITRPSASGSLNTSTGVYTPTAGTQIYFGMGRARPAGTEEMVAVFGDTQTTELRYILTLPHDAPLPQVDDIVAGFTTSDPETNDMVYRVTRVPTGSWLIDRRVGMERVR